MTFPNASLFLVMICFWVTFWLVQKFLITPIGAVLTERKRRVDSAESAWASKHEEYLSATSRLEAEMEEAARQSAKIRSDLRQRAVDARQERFAHARNQADERLGKALEELGVDADAARTDLRRRARELAARFASLLLDREVTP